MNMKLVKVSEYVRTLPTDATLPKSSRTSRQPLLDPASLGSCSQEASDFTRTSFHTN